MRIIRSLNEMRKFSRSAQLKNKRIGFIPTMGALHQGHLSLIRGARKENDIVVVSIFVNPIQFGPKEDYLRYPRKLGFDARLCKKAGTDIIFYPNAKEMYSPAHKTYVVVEDLSEVLCGKFRPGHFKGVATVVLKLFNIVSADTAYFGQKDAQQAIIIRKMVDDLNITTKVKVMPIVREEDGLAMSSRNVYLKKSERLDAAVLHHALSLAKNLVKEGSTKPVDIIRRMKGFIEKKPSARIQYISIVDPDTLLPVHKIKRRVLIVLSVCIGNTRLIDNVVIRR